MADFIIIVARSGRREAVRELDKMLDASNDGSMHKQTCRKCNHRLGTTVFINKVVHFRTFPSPLI